MPYPVISVAQMREWERVTWASGQQEDTVMRQAGRAVADRARQLTRPGDLIFVLAGKGHNGDDAMFAAEGLTDREVAFLRVANPAANLPQIEALLERRPALMIDGLFGIGLNRSLSDDWLRLIRCLNASRRPILAVDVPSGLNADTGLPLDDAVHATHTLTLGAVKTGLLKSTAWSFVGRLEVAGEIGLVPYPFTTEVSLIAPADFADFPPPRPAAGHKGTFGHVAILAGSLGYHGAAVLAARGAQRAQPGLITLYTPERVYEPVARQLQSVMVHPELPPARLPESCTAVVVGPGLASPYLPDTLKHAVQELWKHSPLAVIADATALAWLPPGPTRAEALRVITPHPGEAARLLEVSSGDVQSDRAQSVRELSKRFGQCWVVLKGHQTVVGAARTDLQVNSSGNAHLAQGGSGDLLAGFMGGLLAQPALQDHPAQTLAYAVWQHGAAADRLQATQPNWTIEELAGVLGAVIQ